MAGRNLVDDHRFVSTLLSLYLLDIFAIPLLLRLSEVSSASPIFE